MNRHLVAALCFATALPLAAQTPAPSPKPTPTPHDDTRLEERAQSMREQIDGGRTVRSHVRVLVRLKNGNKLRGVVKDGRFVERVDGLRFVDAQAKDRGAGIRLWYTSGARNYVFVPFADFAEYTVLQRISADELEQMEKQLQMEDARKAERLAQSARTATGKAGAPAAPATTEPSTTEPGEAPPAPGQESGKPGSDAAEPAKPAVDAAALEQQRLWFSLLQAYPPATGWGRSKRDEIARRKVVIGAKPSDHELRFVEQFDDWVKACEHFEVDKEAKPAEDAEPDSTRDRSRRKRR